MEALAFLGLGIALLGAIWFLIVAFSESILWGLVCLLVTPASLLFLVMHWNEAKNPFFVQLAGIGLAFLGAMSAPGAGT